MALGSRRRRRRRAAAAAVSPSPPSTRRHLHNGRWAFNTKCMKNGGLVRLSVLLGACLVQYAFIFNASAVLFLNSPLLFCSMAHLDLMYVCYQLSTSASRLRPTSAQLDAGRRRLAPVDHTDMLQQASTVLAFADTDCSKQKGERRREVGRGRKKEKRRRKRRRKKRSTASGARKDKNRTCPAAPSFKFVKRSACFCIMHFFYLGLFGLAASSSSVLLVLGCLPTCDCRLFCSLFSL